MLIEEIYGLDVAEILFETVYSFWPICFVLLKKGSTTEQENTKRLTHTLPFRFHDRKGCSIECEETTDKSTIQALSRATGQYKVGTDTCNLLLECVWLKLQENYTCCPVGYWSCTLTRAGRELVFTCKDCLVMRWAVLLLRLYLGPSGFIICTNHEAIKWCLTWARVSDKPAR